MNVLGYTACRECGTPVIDAIAFKTSNRCPTHHREWVARRIEAIELRGKGLRVPIPVDKPSTIYDRKRNAAKNKARREDPVKRRKEHLRERAKQAAYRRLRSLFPDVFDVLVAQERERLGLPAWSIDMALTPGSTDETLAFIESYHSADGAPRRSGPTPDRTDEAAAGQ